MRKHIFAVCFILAVPALASAQEASIFSLAGSVEVKADRDAEWVSAGKNMEIREGGAVRTGADGAAVVLMPNKSRIWIRENSGLEIEQRKSMASRLSLLFGRMKVRVPHLMRKERFEVRTPAAVCAVRGTEFTVDATPEGAMDIKVLYGEVKLNFTVPPVKGKSEIHIPQGQFLSLAEKGKPARQALLTKEQEYKALENWNPGLDPKERMAEIIEKENSRAQIKEFAKVTSGAEQQVKAFINTAKESDLEAGRTLNDAHGNLVRVEQRLVRPDPRTLQFVNIVKRTAYSYTDRQDLGGFTYNGGGGARLDLMQMTMSFNQSLPQRIEEWPSFFSANSVKPDKASFISANRTYDDEIFFIAEGYRYDSARDELMNNYMVVDPSHALVARDDPDDRKVVVTGILENDVSNGITAASGLNKIARLEFNDGGAADGTLVYEGTHAGVTINDSNPTNVVWAMKMDSSSDPGLVTSYSQDGDPVLRQYKADAYRIGNDSANDGVWVAAENYVISNGGAIRRSEDFTSSSSDPFTLLKENAGQTILYVKSSVADFSGGGGPVSLSRHADISADDYFSSTRYASGTNIDLVFIPDLAVAAIQRMLPAITELGN
ncbi:MAG: FecR family protein [Elusimicrobiales bacterium]|nr:FecR family protein [Elusimicrobiales bacterium]